jgi:quercetin dioxygenase-like cupin family protein
MIKALILLLYLLGARSPQAPASVPVSVGSEPHHHLKVENEYARVFDVLVPPGEATLFHVHSNDYAYVSLSTVTLKAQILGGQPIDLVLKNGEVRYTRGPITHMIGNPDETPFRNITVEILKPAPRAPAGEFAKLPHHYVELENDRVRILRVALDPGQSTGVHTHVAVNLRVAVSVARVLYDSLSKAETKDCRPGDFVWNQSKTANDLKNVGSTRFEAIEIEFK